MSERKTKVLVIEDDLAVVDYYRSIFDLSQPGEDEMMSALDQITSLVEGDKPLRNTHNLEVTIATQGLNAIHEVCKSQKQGDHYSHAIVDMRLPPGIDGLETAFCLREMNPDIQITFVSAYADHEEEKIDEVLPNGYQMIRKPFSKEQILNVLSA